MRRPTRSTVAGRTYLAIQALARRSDTPTDELLTRFVLERFLYRLARSAHRERLVLKGGMLLEVFDVRRPTRDIDFLGRSIANDTDTIGALMRDIASAEVDDGVLFVVDQLTAVAIREEDVYGGVRVKMPAQLDRARTLLSIDVSVGDAVSPPPVAVTYPTLLAGESFELVGYPMVTLMAEKIETMIRRGAANTRERDFADVWMSHWANHRLQAAHHRLAEFGPLSQPRRHSRQQKTSALDDIDRFTNDVRRAEAKVAHCERRIEEVGPEIDQRPPWDADHNWPDSRLRTVETELAELRRPAHHIEGVTRESHLLRRAPGREQPWLDRVAEVAPAPLPGHDLGAGLDLGP
jgi:hypothetical protein